MQQKFFVFLIFITINALSFAQNVGIGTPTPSEKLDVNGNINVAGTIKVNGTDGSANQVLMKNSAGDLTWGDLSSYKNFMGYYFSGTFTVPPGVTTIAAELWGGGGGGNAAGGGGAGGYVLAIVPVFPGETITITTGSAGLAGTGTANAGIGGITSLQTNSSLNNISAGGGFGAFSSFPGNGGIVSGYSSTVKFTFAQGEAGQINEEYYTQSAAGTFLHVIHYGRGGNSPNADATGGRGGYAVVNESLGFALTNQFSGQGLYRGGGGGGGRDNGSNGGGGYAIIHW